MSLEILHADPSRDAAAISNLIKICIKEKRTVLPAYTPEQEKTYLSNLQKREAVFVAYMNHRFAGFAGVAPRWTYSDKLSHCGEPGTWVMPKFRGQGVGRMLWEKGIIPWCNENGINHLGAKVLAHNTGSIAFYEKMGFQVCGYHRKIVKWDSKYIDAVEIERLI